MRGRVRHRACAGRADDEPVGRYDPDRRSRSAAERHPGQRQARASTIAKAVAPLVEHAALDRRARQDGDPADRIAEPAGRAAHHPGITFGAAEGGNPIGDRPFIRGFDSQGSIYVDGVRDLASQSREVFATESVQIVRGSDSTLGGRGSAGGTINILSKMPELRDFGEVDGSFGNASYKRVTGDLNLKVTDMIAFRIEGLWHDQDVAGRDDVYQRRWGVAPSITIGLGTPTRLTASYYYLESHELPDSGLPYRYVCSATLCNAPTTGNVLSQPALGTFTTLNGQTGTIARSTFYGLTDRDFRNVGQQPGDDPGRA